MPEMDLNDRLVDALVHTGAQVLAEKPGADIVGMIQELRSRAEACIATLSEPEKQVLLSKLRIQLLLQQKDIQREVQRSDTEVAQDVRLAGTEARQFLETFTANDAASITTHTRSAVDAMLPQEAVLDSEKVLSDEELYQEILGVSFDAAKIAVDKPSAKKWIDLVGPVFLQDKALPMISAVGCIPHQLYTAKKFKETVHFPHLANLHEQLKDAEEQSGGVERGRILHARAQLLTQLFQSEIANEAGGEVTLDSNGIFINLAQVKTKEKEYRIHAHLPFSYATDELLTAMRKQGKLTLVDVAECQYRRAEEANDPVGLQEADEKKMERLLAFLELVRRDGVIDKRLQNQLEVTCIMFSQSFVSQIQKQKELVRMPLSLIDSFLRNYNPYRSATYKASLVLCLAETMQSFLTDEYSAEKTGYESYSLTATARDILQKRRSIMHNPGNYDAPRITGKVLEYLDDLEPSMNELRLFRGTIQKEADGMGQSFLEIITDTGRVQRVLLDPDTQLTPKQKENFLRITELSRYNYELLETLASTYSFYNDRINKLRDFNRLKVEMSVKDHREFLGKISRDLNMFLLMEDPEHYAEAMKYHTKFATGEDEIFHQEYVRLCQDALNKFKEKLFTGDIDETIRQFTTEIQSHEVAFDEHFLDDFPERFKKLSYTSDPVLCQELSDIHQSISVVDAGDREIPYAMEAKAIRALQLLPDRPLIGIIGGCRDLPMEEGRISAVDHLCTSLVSAAHNLRANIIPPGTQSGIGIILGRASVTYTQQTEGLSPKQKARFFAVSPGGETYYPGNQHLAPESEKEAMAFAIGPFDSILTPFEAGWDWKGERLRNAPYFRHVEYAEAIYQRLSAGQPRVTVVGNGGLFTIVEAIAALKNNSTMILVRDTGRFADLAIYFQDLRKELSKLDVQGWNARVQKEIETSVPEHSRAALLKAFGQGETITPEQQLYREKLREYFVLSEKADIRTTDVANVETVIGETVKELRQKQNA